MSDATEELDFSQSVYWPINPAGALHSSVFDDAHLHEAFLTYLSGALKCSQTALRQALKTLVKKEAPLQWKNAPVDDSSRFVWLIAIVCNSHELRSQLIALTLYDAHGGRRAKPYRPKMSFDQLLWIAYRNAEPLQDLKTWLDGHLVSRPDRPGLRLLTPEIVASADFLSAAPGGANSIEITRLIILLAARLPRQQMQQLLAEAAAAGCTRVTALATPKAPSDLQDDRVKDQITLDYVPGAPSIPPLPDYIPTKSERSVAFQAAARASAMAAKQAAAVLESTLAQAHPASWVDAPQHKIDGLIAQLNTARMSRVTAADFLKKVQCSVSESLALAGELLGNEILSPDCASDDLDAALGVNLALEELVLLLSESPPPRSLKEKINRIAAPISEADLRKFCAELFHHRSWHNASAEYLAAYVAFDVATSANDSSRIRSLPSRELAALATSCAGPSWTVPCSMLIRLSLERGGSRSSSSVTALICDADTTSERRALLHLLNPELISQLKGRHAKQIAALEYIRDALVFGPIARLGAPHSWLKDATIIGRGGAELLEIITSNLDRIVSGAYIEDALKPAGKSGAREALAGFYEAPIGMKGNYRRLRERAKESLLGNFARSEALSVTFARDLLVQLNSDEAEESIFSDVNDERQGELEGRHRENLRRYLDQARALLESFVAEKRTGDERDAAIRASLLKSSAKLARVAGNHETAWFEVELNSLLTSSGTNIVRQTLQGPDGPLLDLLWTPEHSEWALETFDVAELRMKSAPSTAAVLERMLRCRAEGSKPSAKQIVQKLLDSQCYSSALKFCREVAPELDEVVAKAAEPELTRLHSRISELRSVFGATAVDASPDMSSLELQLRRMDFEQAGETLDLIELALVEGRDLRNRSEKERVRAGELIDKLKMCNIAPGPASDLSSLEREWARALTDLEPQRAHLSCIVGPLRSIAAYLPEIGQVAIEHEQACQDPIYWLPSRTSEDFAYYAKESFERLEKWSESAGMIKPEERRALSILVESSVSYLTQRTRGLAQATSDADGPLALDRLAEVADCIISSGSPASALAMIQRLGEFGQAAGDYAPAPAARPSGRDYRHQLSDSSKALASVPDTIALQIVAEDWSAAIESCGSWSDRLQPQDAETLQAIADACSVFDGVTAVHDPSSLESAVTLISARTIGSHQFSPARRLVLAQRIYAASLIMDGQEDIPADHSKQTWAATLGQKSSVLRRPPSSDGIANRTLNELLSVLATSGIEGGIWDAAAATSDPAAVRAGLLSRLHELDLNESIIKLAAKTEQGLNQKLAQLFELRGVALSRPELITVAEGTAEQIIATSRSAPFKAFLRSLPIAAQQLQPSLELKVDSEVVLRSHKARTGQITVPVIVVPVGFVASRIEASLLADDDVEFAGGGHRFELSTRPIYIPTEFGLKLQFGSSWGGTRGERATVRLRVRALSVTGARVSSDHEIGIRAEIRTADSANVIDDDTLLDAYPGVSNTPAIDAAFIGRLDELELLHKLLVSARNPSPVLLIGLRRIGKTSLMFAFHSRHRVVHSASAFSLYVSLAERRMDLTSSRHSVSEVLFNAIVHAIVRPNVSSSDQNFQLCSRVREFFNNDWRAARELIRSCFDPESLADSLTAMREMVATWCGSQDSRMIILIDEAEALVAAYNAGDSKRLELEQLLQSIREISQRDPNIAVLLAGSNHINVFAREYKNAFFGSSQKLELSGLGVEYARSFIAPTRVTPFVSFDQASISYAHELCAGMPQFMWQLGATAAHMIRTGSVTRADVRRAIAVLTSHESTSLPFKSYDALEPIDSIIALEGERERDLLWMLLYKVAQSCSLIVEEAATAFAVDQSLLQIDDRDSWKSRIARLAELGILKFPTATTVAFQVPVFAEAFRASRNWQEYSIREQKVLR